MIRILRHTLWLLAAATLAACSKEVPGYDPPALADRTVLLYMPGQSLIAYYENNIQGIRTAVTGRALGKGRMLVCWQPDDQTSAVMQEIYYDRNKRCSETKTLKTYDDFDAGDPAAVQQLFADAAELAPARNYGLIIGCHGKAWIPASGGVLPRSILPADDVWTTAPGAKQTRSFGDTGYELDITELAAALAQADCPAQMLARLTDFYRTRGVGLLGLGQVFRAESAPGGARLTPVEERLPVRLGDLVGYEKQKQQLLANTESFLAGHHANNVLLYGDAGTGKSTSIQAIANEYAAQGLRLIEIYKDQYALIPAILRQIKSRNYRFILFLDDLSFEENETSYKYLKAVMEGGAEAAPENVRIYATSNRRHLVRGCLALVHRLVNVRRLNDEI